MVRKKPITKQARWQKLLANSRAQRRVAVLKSFVLVFVFVLVGLSIFKARHFFSGSWDGKHRFNFVLIGQPLFIVSFQPLQKTGVILTLPPEALIESLYGYGFYRAESLYRLSQLENRGGQLVEGSLQAFLGLPVEGFLVNKEAKGEKSDVTNSLALALKGEAETNLTVWDLLRLWWQTKRIRTDKLTLFDMSQTSASKQVLLADGSQAVEIDPQKLEKIINDYFKDDDLANEDLSIAVLNSTSFPGLAQKAARLVENIGGRVVTIGDWPDLVKKCQIRSKKSNQKSYTVQKLTKTFSCQWEEGSKSEQRAEAVLILGEDYWSKLSAK